MNTTRPFLPTERSRGPAPDPIVRACYAIARARSSNEDPGAVAALLFKGDEATIAIATRAATAPGMTTGVGWADSLGQSVIGNFFAALDESAAATLMTSGLRVSLAPANTIAFPLRPAGPAAAAWVAEADPIPATSAIFDTVALGPPRKIAALNVMTKELMRRSDAARIFATMLREDAARALDASIFSSEDGTGTAPAGLLNGATSIAGTGDPLRDLQLLAQSVSANGGSGEVVFVAGPGIAAAASVDASVRATVLSSPAVPATTVIALDPRSIVWSIGEVEIETSSESVLHMSDIPLPVSDAGVADPTRGLFQTACIATRLILDAAFAKRRADAVAYVDGVSY